MKSLSLGLTALAQVGCLACVLAADSSRVQHQRRGSDFIRVSVDGRRFVFTNSGNEFRPWGFNYDHDASGRLLEDYWETEWDAVARDFHEMKAMGANMVRIHLQVGQFLSSARTPNQPALRQLGRVLKLAEQTGLYLDVTGLGCYNKPDVPGWYNELTEAQRWDAQAVFWDAVARVCSGSPAVFCYDLMNEPIVTEDKKAKDWTPGALGDRYFVQRLALDFAGRTATQIAKAWVDKMVITIRQRDRKHLVTVGAIPWALTWPAAKPLFYSKAVSENLDFVSLHFYPKTGEIDQAITALSAYNIGKPLVIEEIFPLNCSIADLNSFIDRSKPLASGWMGFYWGKTIERYRVEKGRANASDTITLGWLEFFVQKTKGIKREGGH